MSDKISFDFEARKFTGIKLSQAEFWQKVYPDISIDDLILKRIPAWLDANPAKAHKKNWKRFLVNWFSSEQGKRDMVGGKYGSLFYKVWGPTGKFNEAKEI
jgi:hypothetical protein